MEVLQKPGTKSATTSRSSIVLETSVVAKLEKLAYVQGTSAAVAFQRMVEQVLGLPSVATCFHEYIQEYWWGYAPVEATARGWRGNPQSATLPVQHNRIYPED